MKIKVTKPQEHESLECIKIQAIEEGGELGRAHLVAEAHVEEVVISPEHRGGLALARLMEAAEVEAGKLGITKLFAYAVNDTNADYLERLGYTKQPWTVWVKEISKCHS